MTDQADPARLRPAKRRREPRFGTFVATGAVVGFVLSVVAALASPGSGNYSALTAFGYMAVLGALVGALLGGVVAAALSGRR